MSFKIESMSADEALGRLSRRQHDAEVVRLNDEACQLIRKGRHEKAREKLHRALELNPDYPTAYVNMGASYMEQERWSDAVPALEKALALHPEIEGAADALQLCHARARSQVTGQERSSTGNTSRDAKKWWQFWK